MIILMLWQGEYRYMAGVIAGLALAERDLLDLLERADETS